MKAGRVRELIAEGESSVLEFKRLVNSPLKLAKEFSAFANTRGGVLMIGVDDDGTIVGVYSEKTEVDVVERACAFYIDPPLTPQIEILGIGGKYLIIITIEQSQTKPHKIVTEDKESPENGRVYIRIGEKSVIASREMTHLMRYLSDETRSLTLSIGEKERGLFNFLEKYERATVKDFSLLVNISLRRAERLMIRLVRAGVLQIHNDEHHDYFTLV